MAEAVLLAKPAPLRQMPTSPAQKTNIEARIRFRGFSIAAEVQEGTSFHDTLCKAAENSRGFVLSVYYPQYDAHKIVAIVTENGIEACDNRREIETAIRQREEAGLKISGELVGKIMEAAEKSSGSAHLYAGLEFQNVHFQVGQNGELVFPNFKELKVTDRNRLFSIENSTEAFDPREIKDLEERYANREGAKFDPARLRQAQGGHAGNRTDQIEFDNTLVINIHTGQSETLYSFSSRIDQMATPEPQPLQYAESTLTRDIRFETPSSGMMVQGGQMEARTQSTPNDTFVGDQRVQAAIVRLLNMHANEETLRDGIGSQLQLSNLSLPRQTQSALETVQPIGISVGTMGLGVSALNRASHVPASSTPTFDLSRQDMGFPARQSKIREVGCDKKMPQAYAKAGENTSVKQRFGPRFGPLSERPFLAASAPQITILRAQTGQETHAPVKVHGKDPKLEAQRLGGQGEKRHLGQKRSPRKGFGIVQTTQVQKIKKPAARAKAKERNPGSIEKIREIKKRQTSYSLPKARKAKKQGEIELRKATKKTLNANEALAKRASTAVVKKTKRNEGQRLEKPKNAGPKPTSATATKTAKPDLTKGKKSKKLPESILHRLLGFYANREKTKRKRKMGLLSAAA